jgi:hypothetical protein
MDDLLPDLRSIHDPVHPGLTRALAACYAEAAEVCLSRHHEPPHTTFAVECGGMRAERGLVWRSPSGAAGRAYNNRDDATRDGAYIVSIAAVNRELGLVALLRAETRTGADYYVGPPGARDIEEAFRLEVSGTDTGSIAAMRGRLQEKVEQARAGESDLPAYASVVGFLHRRILITPVEIED